MNKKDRKVSTSDLILRQTCLRVAVELHGQGTAEEQVLKTADEFISWVKK